MALTFLDRIIKSNRHLRLGDLMRHVDLFHPTHGTLTHYGVACAQAVDFYLNDAYKDERKEIV
jgi:hypothetical protein